MIVPVDRAPLSHLVIRAVVASRHSSSEARDPFGGDELVGQVDRPRLRSGSPAWVTHSPITCSTRFASIPARSITSRWAIPSSQRVGLFYGSANFDTDVFDNPHGFDITRDPNPHLGFGGTGAHYCIGENLARLEIDLMFNAIADAMPNVSQVAEPRRLRSAWLNGIKEYQVSYR